MLSDQVVNLYSLKTAVKCENKTPWDARTINNKQLHAD